MLKLFTDGEISLTTALNPNRVKSGIANQSISDTVQIYAFDDSALTGAHFLAIPWNSDVKAASLLAINFLLSPEAQSVKGDFEVWGDPPILNLSNIVGDAAKTKRFNAIPMPHPSWHKALQDEWKERYEEE